MAAEHLENKVPKMYQVYTSVSANAQACRCQSKAFVTSIYIHCIYVILYEQNLIFPYDKFMFLTLQ